MSSSVPVVLKPTGVLTKKRKYDAFDAAEPSVPREAKRDLRSLGRLRLPPPAAKLKRDHQAEFAAAEPSVPRGAKRDLRSLGRLRLPPPAAKPLPSYSELTKQNESLNRMISELQAKNQALEQTALKIYLEARDVGAEVEIPDIAKNWRVRYATLNGCEYRRVEHYGGAVILYYKNESSNKWVVFPEGHAVQDILMKASWLGVGHW